MCEIWSIQQLGDGTYYVGYESRILLYHGLGSDSEDKVLQPEGVKPLQIYWLNQRNAKDEIYLEINQNISKNVNSGFRQIFIKTFKICIILLKP